MPINADKVQRIFNVEIAKRKIYSYLNGMQYGINDKVNPCHMQNLTDAIPQLRGKVEIEPFCKHIDQMANSITIGWNMFVLGRFRMYLGHGKHRDIRSLSMMVNNTKKLPPTDDFYDASTVKEILTFLSRTLHDHEDGLVDWNSNGDNCLPGVSYMPTNVGTQATGSNRF